MAQSFDVCEHAMLGQALADNFQTRTLMSLTLSRNLRKSKAFDEINVMADYLHCYHISKYRVDEPTKLVFEELISTKNVSSNKVTREQFKFPIEQIQSAVRSAHDKLKGLSGGCTPAQRSFPLACCPWIKEKDLFQIACDEAKLTHFCPTAGQVSGVINLICRRLIKGDSWDDAVNTAFSTVPNMLGEIREIQTRYTRDSILNSHSSPGYAPNALHTALYCVTNADSFESALRRARKLDAIYCPILVGILAGARWGIPSSIINTRHPDAFNEIHLVAKYFTDEWKKQPVAIHCLYEGFFAMPKPPL